IKLYKIKKFIIFLNNFSNFMETSENNFNLPSKFKALILHDKYNVKYEDISYNFNNLDKDHLVIKVHSAGIGPYDTGFYIGRLIPEEYNTTFGIEGSGLVVKFGSNCDSSLLNKRVAF